jgi:DNA-binding transcriptional ArsR family regulator
MVDSLDIVFAALSDPTRRRLLETLAEREPISTRELTRGFSVTRWAVMKHLGVLRDAGLIATLPQGRRRLHFLDRRGLEEARRWLERLT